MFLIRRLPYRRPSLKSYFPTQYTILEAVFNISGNKEAFAFRKGLPLSILSPDEIVGKNQPDLNEGF